MDITTDYTYVVIGGDGLSHTKSEWKLNLDAIGNNEYLFAVTIDYNCNTNLEMILSDNYNGATDTDDDTWWNLIISGFSIWSRINDGCYRVTFSDCDDSFMNYRAHDHEFYVIIVGHHGYYGELGAEKKFGKVKQENNKATSYYLCGYGAVFIDCFLLLVFLKVVFQLGIQYTL